MVNKKAGRGKITIKPNSGILNPVARSIISSLDGDDWQIITFDMPEGAE